MWYVLAICWFPIELAIRRVFWVFSIWINQSCCQCELRCSNDIGSCQKDVQIPTSLGREDAQGQNSSSETNPTSQAKPFFFSADASTVHRQTARLKLRKLNDSCTYLSGVSNARTSCTPEGNIYFNYIYPLQVPRKPKQHFWQIPKDPCMEKNTYIWFTVNFMVNGG